MKIRSTLIILTFFFLCGNFCTANPQPPAFRNLDLYGVNYLGNTLSNPQIDFDAKMILVNHSGGKKLKIKIHDTMYCLAWQKSDGEGTTAFLLPFDSENAQHFCDFLKDKPVTHTLTAQFSKNFPNLELLKTTTEDITKLFGSPSETIQAKSHPAALYNSQLVYEDKNDSQAQNSKDAGELSECNAHSFYPKLYLYFKDNVLIGVSQSPHSTLC